MQWPTSTLPTAKTLKVQLEHKQIFKKHSTDASAPALALCTFQPQFTTMLIFNVDLSISDTTYSELITAFQMNPEHIAWPMCPVPAQERSPYWLKTACSSREPYKSKPEVFIRKTIKIILFGLTFNNLGQAGIK